MGRALIVGGWMFAACSFEARLSGDGGIDAPDGDVPPEALPSSATCKTIKAENPTAADGMYLIDPDMGGPQPPFNAWCDMTLEGGGWTVVFLPTSSNFSSTAIGYTASSERLLNDANQVLLSYRDSSNRAVAERAVFPMIQDWRLASPFSYSNGEASIIASVNEVSGINTTIKYGSYSFTGDFCADPWDGGTRWGRLCIVGTMAPFFAGFAVTSPDSCTTSQSVYNTRLCGTELRFTIAVR